MITVLIPVLGRPHRVEPLLESLQHSERDVPLVPMFIVSPGDEEQLAAVRASGADFTVVPWEPGDGDYARKMNVGHRNADTPWVFLGADDLLFHRGWAEAAVEVAENTGARVVGTNDLGNRAVVRGRHSTHTLVASDYTGTFDDQTVLLHEGYSHNFVDNEFVETAKARRAWGFSRLSVVEHLHWAWSKAEMDPTYRKAQARFGADSVLFRRRMTALKGEVRAKRLKPVA